MRQVLEMRMDAVKERDGFTIGFEGGVTESIGDLLTAKELTEIRKHFTKIADVIHDAIVRDLENEFGIEIDKVEPKIETKRESGGFDELQKELYDALPEEEKKKIREYEDKMEKLRTKEEKIDFTLKTIMEEMERMKNAR